MRSITALSLAVALIGLSYSCGSKEAAPDASAPDGMLPPGVQGDILRVPEVQSTTIPDLQGPVQVVRVEAGIPHVFASNEHDLRVVQGYLSARARLYFFEIGRLYALGRIGELLGDVRLEADIQARSQGMAYVAQRILEKLSPEQAEDIDNFVKGVNAFVANVKSGVEAPPVEVPILGPVLLERPATNLLPEYTRADVAAFAAAITYDQGFETDEPLRELVLAQLQGAFDDLPFAEQREQGAIADLWGRVQPIVEVSSTPGFGVNGEAPARTSASLPSPVSLPASMLERLERRHELSPGIFHRQRGVDFGSNEWAVMGSHTRDGRTLLAGDGHLSLSVPALFMQIGLDTTVFGDGENGLRQVGMTFPGSPVMGPGTNGSVAWTITYFDGDVTDWYREEIRLSADGMPEASRFRGEWKPLIKVDETYEFRSVPALGSEARTIVMPRFQTFDGRWITAIEGADATEETTASTGETLLNIYGSWVIPKDTDSDGVISGISFDYTGFDIGQTLGVVDAMGRANSVGEIREHTRGLVGFAQNIMAADVHGDIFFDGGYSATPCREYLPRRDDGSWEEGADPRRLLDGTQYGAFEVQLDENERPVESPDAPCIIPFDEWPQGLSPEEGFLVNANNDTARLSFDGSLHNDRHYIGGPFAPGFRAESIRDGLVELTSSREADIASMSALQGNHRSALGQLAAPALVSAVEEAAALASTDGPLTERQQRIVDILNEDEPGLTEAATRLTDWVASGAMAASGVETFYNPAPSEQETGDAVATMIFNAWLRAFVNAVIEDEPFGDLFTISQRNQVGWLLHDLVAGRGPDNPRGLASWNEEIEASVFLDRTETPFVESFEEVALGALRDALAGLRLPPTEPGVGGFGTSSMSSWLWGLRHQVQFQSFILVYAGDTDGVDLIAGRLGITPDQMPLADGIDESDPRFGLTGFPRPGDYFAVDASHPSLTAPDFHYGYGPVMRMVFALEEGNISGVNVVPGGSSPQPSSPHFADQAALWLGNETVPVRFTPEDVIEGAQGREQFTP